MVHIITYSASVVNRKIAKTHFKIGACKLFIGSRSSKKVSVPECEGVEDERTGPDAVDEVGVVAEAPLHPVHGLYTIMINYQLSIYTSKKHSLLSLKLLALVLNSLNTLSDVRIKAFTLLF